MNTELTNKFYKEFPDLLKKENMQFGFECSDGWSDIIWEACEKIREVLHDLKVDGPTEAKARLNGTYKNFEIVQIKEKFGSLRIYTNWDNYKIDKIIQRANEKSLKTCEICGEPGEIRPNGYLQTLCNQHFEEENNG